MQSQDPVVHASEGPARRRPGPLFWLLTVLLCAYVALCTNHRDSIREADAWEHHRAVLALREDFWVSCTLSGSTI